MILRSAMMGMALAMAAFGMVACDGPGGSGSGGPPANQTPQPTQTNKVDAQVKDGSGAATDVDGEQAQPSEGAFGGGIAGTVLNLWMTSSNGTLISVVIDTATHELPATVQIGEVNSTAFVTMTQTLPMPGVFVSGANSGSITINQCPKAAGEALTGAFGGIKLTSEAGGGEVTLSGTFNLMVGPVSGALQCKVVTQPQPDAGPTDDVPTGGSCDMGTCDGPCCPYQACLASCSAACMASPACQNPNPADPFACMTCSLGCFEECGVSQQCMDALEAVNTCEENAGCFEFEDEAYEACGDQHCCAERKAAL